MCWLAPCKRPRNPHPPDERAAEDACSRGPGAVHPLPARGRAGCPRPARRALPSARPPAPPPPRRRAGGRRGPRGPGGFSPPPRGGGGRGPPPRLAAPSLPPPPPPPRRYQRADEPLDDLIQVASIGLIKAIDRFDPDR